jgi:hypothetical protein
MSHGLISGFDAVDGSSTVTSETLLLLASLFWLLLLAVGMTYVLFA